MDLEEDALEAVWVKVHRKDANACILVCNVSCHQMQEQNG